MSAIMVLMQASTAKARLLQPSLHLWMAEVSPDYSLHEPQLSGILWDTSEIH